ncbi:response regulator transcription factor [Streptomyces sp. S.PNR 29]|uniref:response regulator transcription factor n=1 Tax=Streptomyces sp. S.PNR 29 TaxID=2973805 RepID=UPI0025B212FA|nr:response regulator transcription factor [Streptomyces sp. S.PNR 29]MDN0199920.1 response regulator transcription factor [Streptomyces sp. S.PNR 29]
MIVAEDSGLFREGLVRLLTDAGIEVAGQTGDCESLPRLVAHHAPDVVLLDIRMPPTHTDEGIAAATAVRARFPAVGVLLLSHYVETGGAIRALAASPRGFGYLLKDRVADVGELHDALKRVAAGESVIDPQVVARLLGRPRADGHLDSLTRREREVLAAMAEGRSNDAITRILDISGKTLETHIRSIFTKLGLEPDLAYHRRVQAVITYLRA